MALKTLVEDVYAEVPMHLRRQYNAGGKQQIDSFLELCSSFGADVGQILSTLGQYWGPAAASWFCTRAIATSLPGMTREEKITVSPRSSTMLA